MSKNPALLYKSLVVGVIVLFIGAGIQPSVAIHEQLENGIEYVEVIVEICDINHTKQFSIYLTLEEVDELKNLFNDNKAQLKESSSEEESERIFKDAIIELERFGILDEYSVKEVQSLVLGENYDSSSYNKYIIQKGKSNSNCMIRGETTNTGFFSKEPRAKEFLQILYAFYYITSRLLLLFPITLPLYALYIVKYHYLLYNLFYLLHLYPILAKPLNKRISLFGNLFPFEYDRSITLGISEDWGPEIIEYSEGWVWTNGSNGIVEWEGDKLYGDTGLAWGSLDWGFPYEEAVQGFTGINIFIGYYILGILDFYSSILGDSYYIGRADFVKINNTP